ncbi:MAG: element excision factor XisH family protein [Chloroflexales bacterium]
MPAKDRIHDQVKHALIADGWTITSENYTIRIDERNVVIDIFAERGLLAARRNDEHIAVEVKSFLGPSPVNDLRDAIGQYILYRSVLRRADPHRMPYLAVDSAAAAGILSEPIGQAILHDEHVRLIVVDIQQERIIEWIP